MAIAVAFAASTPRIAPALPPGRGWTPIDTLRIHGHPYMFANRIDDLPDGRLQFIVTGYYGPGQYAYGMNWNDSVWVERWSGLRDNYIMWPTVSPRDQRMLVWKTTVPGVDRKGHLVTATDYGDSVSVPDTVAACSEEALLYSGCALEGTRWVALRDREHSQLGSPFHLRIYRSVRNGPWRRVRDEDRGVFAHFPGLSIVGLDSTTLLVVTADDDNFIRWGTLRDTTWSAATPPLSGFGLMSCHQFRVDPRGGHWFAWAQGDRGIYVNRHVGDAWVEPDTVLSAFPDGLRWGFYQPMLSRDTGTYPAIAWHGFDDQSLIDHVWATFPSDSGFGYGEKLEGTAFGYLPQVARDENGDVWLAFSRDLAGAFWLHTYVSAITSAPEVIERSGRPLVRWSLSESVPESWWMVERAFAAGPFEPVARLRATRETLMQWIDTTGPTNEPMRYRIRRECKDVRYRWWSAEATWEPRGPALRLSRNGAHPAADAIEFEVSGAAAGALTVRLHDLQGRVVLAHALEASGSARDALRLPLAGTALRPGIYILRAQGGDGRISPGLKVAIVR